MVVAAFVMLADSNGVGMAFIRAAEHSLMKMVGSESERGDWLQCVVPCYLLCYFATMFLARVLLVVE